jgi:iron complex outermembrane receptor protein
MTFQTKSNHARRLLCGCATLAFFLAAVPAHAQATGAPEAAPAAEDSGDIVVTASRRQENAKDVPVAVTALTGEKLDVLNSSGLDIRFLSSRTPSLQIESSFGRTFPRFYIRGLGNTDFDPNAAQPVSVVYDDVALESPMLKSFPVFDLQSVEVMRGPQGTLFGRNTPAGVVKLDSAKPSSTFNGYGSVEWGSYNTVNAEGAVGGPLGGGFEARISGLLQRRDDWVHNTATSGVADKDLEGYRDIAGRAQLGYTSGDFHALLNVHARDLNGSPRIFRAGLFKQGSNQFNTGFSKNEVALDGYTSQSLKQWGTNLHLDYRVPGLGTFYSITAYEHAKVESTGDIDGGDTYTFPPLALNEALFPSSTGGLTKPSEFSQELRFASDEMGNFRFQAGAYYFHQRLRYHEYDYAFPYTTRAANLDQDLAHNDLNENYGVFASGEYKLDRLTLRAGVRYSHDHKDDFVSGYAPSFALSDTLPTRAKISGSDVTWDASATYAATRWINLYARVATGYQGPAIQDRVTFGSFQNTAPKQTTISAEGGIKGQTLDRRLNFALDVYWNRTKNLQITAVGGATNSARLLSADHVLGHGVEAEMEARPLPNLTFTASGSYNFTKIKDPNLVVGVCGALCTVVDPETTVNGATVAFINGNPLPQAPRYVGNLTLRYGIPLANGDEIFAITDWAYRSKINYFLYEAKEFRGRSLTEGGLKVGYQMHNGIEVAVFARNILNQIRAVSAIDFNNLTGMINDPRIIGGSVKYKF